VGAQLVLVRGQAVEAAVEPVVVDLRGGEAEQVVERRGIEPLLGHAQLRGLAAEARDRQQGGGVGPGDRLAAGGQEFGEESIQAQAMPEREGEVAFTEVAAALDP
jgi:hypothetical protein